MVNPLSSNPTRTGWIDLINKSAHTADDIDIGDIHAINRDFVVVKRGFVNIHYYYIPITKVEGWDGHVLWIKAIESELKGNYERDKVPDPRRYYIKDYPYYNPAILPELLMIPARYRPSPYPTEAPPGPNEPLIHECDLCTTSFESEDELSKHIVSQH